MYVILDLERESETSMKKKTIKYFKQIRQTQS